MQEINENGSSHKMPPIAQFHAFIGDREYQIGYTGNRRDGVGKRKSQLLGKLFGPSPDNRIIRVGNNRNPRRPASLTGPDRVW